jgi:LPS sulfotransferase NodH
MHLSRSLAASLIRLFFVLFIWVPAKIMSKKKLFFPTVSHNDHLKNTTQFFGAIAHAPANIPEHIKFIFICFTNRSGSNYLAELLASDQYHNVAGEDLNSDEIIRQSQKNSLKSFQEYFSFMVDDRKKNGFVCLKISTFQIEMLGKSGILDQIIHRTHFVIIERSDKLAQAISHLIAFQTGVFSSIKSHWEKKSEPVFERESLDHIIENIAESYGHFNIFFARNGIRPVNVIYEQMVEDPSRTLSFISSRTETPKLKVAPERIQLERQAGRLNAEWRQKYLQDETTELNTATAPY